MKKIICFILFISISATSYSQIDFSFLLKDKISRSDLKKFNNIHKKYKKVLRTECIYGDCKTTKSAKKITFLKTQNSWSNAKFESEYYYYIIGNFKNGKLNGNAGIYLLAEDKRGFLKKYFNVEELDKVLKTGDLDVINSAKLMIKEYIYAEFKDNIVSEGTYFIDFSFDHYTRNFENTILTNASPWSKNLPAYRYFKDIPLNQSENRKRLLYIYDGKFQTDNYLQYGFNNNTYNSIELYFWTNGSNYIKYGIVPGKSYTNKTDFVLDYSNMSLKYEVVRNGVKEYNSVYINFTDKGECIGCNISNSSQIANNINNDALAEIKHKLEEKVNRAKSLVDHFAEKYGVYYYINNYSADGCVSGNIYPTRAYWEKDYVLFSTDCSPENFNIMNNASVCPNCDGWGTEDVKVTYNTTYYTKDNVGNRTYDKSPSRSGTVVEKHSCHICKGKGLIIK